MGSIIRIKKKRIKKKSLYTKKQIKKNNIWVRGTPKEVIRGVVAWENCLEVPDGIIESMDEDVDNWKAEQTLESTKTDEAAKSLYNDNGPIRFYP